MEVFSTFPAVALKRARIADGSVARAHARTKEIKRVCLSIVVRKAWLRWSFRPLLVSLLGF